VIASEPEPDLLMGEVPKKMYPSSVTAPGHLSSTIPVSPRASFSAAPEAIGLWACLTAPKAGLPLRKGQDVSGTLAMKSSAKGQVLNYRTDLFSAQRHISV